MISIRLKLEMRPKKAVSLSIDLVSTEDTACDNALFLLELLIWMTKQFSNSGEHVQILRCALQLQSAL